MTYTIPPDTREKEKIFGGHFTLTQAVFLVLAAVSGGGTFLITFGSLGLILSAIVSLLIAVPFLPFAFIKVEACGDVELIQYVWIRIKFHNAQKVYVNVNDNFRAKLLNQGMQEDNQ